MDKNNHKGVMNKRPNKKTKGIKKQRNKKTKE